MKNLIKTTIVVMGLMLCLPIHVFSQMDEIDSLFHRADKKLDQLISKAADSVNSIDERIKKEKLEMAKQKAIDERIGQSYTNLIANGEKIIKEIRTEVILLSNKHEDTMKMIKDMGSYLKKSRPIKGIDEVIDPLLNYVEKHCRLVLTNEDHKYVDLNEEDWREYNLTSDDIPSDEKLLKHRESIAETIKRIKIQKIRKEELTRALRILGKAYLNMQKLNSGYKAVEKRLKVSE